MDAIPQKHILDHLSRDPVLKKLIDTCILKPRPGQPTVYEALIRSINFQQLSGASATAIHGRFLNLFPDQYPHPEQVIGHSHDTLRSVGLSRQKAQYVQNAAQFFIENDLMDTQWEKMSDKEIIHLLTQIKGVGKWTVEMILMFTLDRPDVLPLDDLVVKNSIIELYNVKELRGRALTKKLLDIAEPWRPYRSTASRYLWESKQTKL